MNGAKSLGLSTGFVPFQVQLIFVGLVSCRSLALFYRIFLLSSDSVASWILWFFCGFALTSDFQVVVVVVVVVV